MAPRQDVGLELTRRLRVLLAQEGPEPGAPFPCPYLPDREARHVTVVPSPLLPGLYQSFMDLNFRRSGLTFYRPACPTCRACQMLRVDAAAFAPDRAQRRCARRNRDLAVRVGTPSPSEEKRALFGRYLEARHDGAMDATPETFEGFLYSSPLATLEIEYRAGDRLVGVGIADLEPRALSAVYFYFDPADAARSPGVFNVLTLVEECRRRKLPHLYLGYWVPGSKTMDYKDRYRPCEVLDPESGFVRLG